MTWVPFHSSLREGDKRGLTRAARFIYLEISLLTRPTGGELALPRGFRSDADALHDTLGGDRREVRLALAELTSPLDPADPESALILLRGPTERRVISIRNHSKWVKSDQSRDRVSRFRARRREQDQRDRSDATVTVTALEERRGEERREEEICEGALTRSEPPPSTGSSVHDAEPTAEAQSQPKTRTAKTPRGSRLPEAWEPKPEVLERFRSREGVDATRCIERFKNHWLTSTGSNAVKVDWDRTFVNWVLEDIDRGKSVAWSPPASQSQLALTSRTPRVDVVDGPFVPPPPEALAAMAKLGLRPKGDLAAEVLATVEHADVRFRKAGH